MQGELLISVEDLDDVRLALIAAHSYINAIDIAESQKMMLPTTRESSLATCVREGIEMAQGYLDRYLRERYDAGDFDGAPDVGE